MGQEEGGSLTLQLQVWGHSSILGGQAAGLPRTSSPMLQNLCSNQVQQRGLLTQAHRQDRNSVGGSRLRILGPWAPPQLAWGRGHSTPVGASSKDQGLPPCSAHLRSAVTPGKVGLAPSLGAVVYGFCSGESQAVRTKSSTVLPEGAHCLDQSFKNFTCKGVVKTNGDLGREQ